MLWTSDTGVLFETRRYFTVCVFIGSNKVLLLRGHPQTLVWGPLYVTESSFPFGAIIWGPTEFPKYGCNANVVKQATFAQVSHLTTETRVWSINPEFLNILWGWGNSRRNRKIYCNLLVLKFAERKIIWSVLRPVNLRWQKGELDSPQMRLTDVHFRDSSLR